MTKNLHSIPNLLRNCTEDELRKIAVSLRNYLPKHPLEEKWGISSDVILTAVDRSPDLTQRGVRGIIAEAVFASKMHSEPPNGWKSEPIEGNFAYDALLRRGDRTITIQVKLQRRERGVPKLARKQFPEHFVVEVQKTRGGVDRVSGEATRPYRFGEFDILAVNMHPSTKDWHRFMFATGASLIPRRTDPRLIEIFQPVSPVRNSDWTDSLQECIQWVTERRKHTICSRMR